ncbi:hypothetical protein CIPAW_08G108000 [Carya illinoinensis]|uniref:Uncharacterized protein n=1 Tax=Carya illinoinensis TaxID=32201 RepID=A0A8T1PLR0_CARIL|nr:hypothetical protein CIPAW_08G108000 [Carya illinoinensis]
MTSFDADRLIFRSEKKLSKKRGVGYKRNARGDAKFWSPYANNDITHILQSLSQSDCVMCEEWTERGRFGLIYFQATKTNSGMPACSECGENGLVYLFQATKPLFGFASFLSVIQSVY